MPAIADRTALGSGGGRSDDLDTRVVAKALAPRLAGTSAEQLCPFTGRATRSGAPFNVTPTYVQVSACDQRCFAGEVRIAPGASARDVELSGELFALRPRRTGCPVR